MSEPSEKRRRADLVAELQGMQRLISTRTVLFHQLIGEKLGLGPTDHKCLEYSMSGGDDAPVTAGHLAEVTGLTTGAITGVLDRLERAGFIRREKDPDDRRQVRIRPIPERLREIGQLFEPTAAAWQALCDRFTEDELVTIGRFSRAALDMVAGEIERLKAHGAPPAVEEGVAAPLGTVKRGELVMTGAQRLNLVATDEPVLFRAVWDGAPARIRVDDGEVHIRADRRGGRLALQAGIPWRLRFRGGVAGLEADVRRLGITELDISGGALDVKLRLGAPRGTTPIAIRGGAERLSILRPAGVPASVEVRGGAAGVVLESLRLGDVGGALRWATPDYGGARERYAIEVSGGVHALDIGVG